MVFNKLVRGRLLVEIKEDNVTTPLIMTCVYKNRGTKKSYLSISNATTYFHILMRIPKTMCDSYDGRVFTWKNMRTPVLSSHGQSNQTFSLSLPTFVEDLRN